MSLHHFIIQYSDKLINKKGLANIKNEIIWYLEYLKICDRQKIYLNEIVLTSELCSLVENFGNKRLQGIPFQYIINKGTFYGRDFLITEHTLIPRPETESLIHCIKNKFFNSALEIGTGSGILALTLLKEKIVRHVLATDISSQALAVAQKNALQMNVSNITFQKHDFLKESINGKYDLIISNPPYISKSEFDELPNSIKNYEPNIALTDNNDGLDFYMRFADILSNILESDGMFICELGSSKIISSVKQIFESKKYKIQIFKDMNLDDRVLQITL